MIAMFERLLAALIVLALLVIVMFIALPYTPGSEPARAPSVEKPAPPESARAKPPAAGQNDAIKNEAAPPPEKPAGGAKDVPVPNPPANGVGKAPTLTEKQERDGGGGKAPPKQKSVKNHQDKLPISAEAEPPSKTVPAAKPDKPKPQTVSRMPAQQPPRQAFIKGDRERDDGIGDYIRRTGYNPLDWHRTHYYECADGRCDCSCDRPYWAKRGPPCWD